jgi:exopolysaccharide biosynthesis protein
MRTLRSRTVAVIALALLASCSTGSRAEGPKKQQASPVAYRHVVRQEPNFSVHVVTVDLKDPRVSVRVSRAGEDPDGAGPWQTVLLPTSEIAKREGFDIAVNGDFFGAQATKDVEGKNTGFVKGKWASAVGPAMTDGEVWAKNATTRPALEVTSKEEAKIATVRAGAAFPKDVRQVIAGSHVIVKDGKKVDVTGTFSTARHPRTAVGITRDGSKLILLVVDGRQPKLSIGMQLSDLADEMIAQGAYNALNLDGGGSSTMVYRDPASKQLKVLNSPSDSKERSVANVLGVKVDGPLPEVK